MLGGKVASYRIFAEEATDALMAYLDAPAVPCRTHVAFLPGGEGKVSSVALAEELGIDRIAAARLIYRHGSRANAIAERVRERPLEATVVCPCEPGLEAEGRHVIKHEMAATVDDFARRTPLARGAC